MRSEELLLVVLLLVLMTFSIGGVCGVAALIWVRRVQQQLRTLQSMLRQEGRGGPEIPETRADTSRPTVGDKPTEQPSVTSPASEGDPPARQYVSPAPYAASTGRTPPPPPPPPRRASKPIGETPGGSGLSLEMLLGARWMARVGMVMVVIGLAFLIRFAYDHAWIGPAGRLALGCVAGIVALLLGEHARRNAYDVLFQTLTGGGLAIFYVCIYFSFQIYAFTGPGFSMALGVLVSAAAVVLAVGHNAVAIAIIGLIGGYLSPVLLSGGGNYPYTLFTYLLVVNLVALGVAYFRRWRALDGLAFLATAGLYAAWHIAHYDATQMTPALLFTTLFYLVFLIIPSVYSLARQIPLNVESLVLLGVNSAVWLVSYYVILYDDYTRALGFVVIGQALLVFGLFQAYRRRNPKDATAANSLLVITLILATLAIPLQLELYGIPIAWGVEGVLLAYLGLRYRNALCQGAAFAALALAAAGLIYRLPLHTAAFTPVLNVPFGSWAVIIAASASVACVFHRYPQGWCENIIYSREIAGLLAYGLSCVLLTLEAWSYWNYHHPGVVFRETHRFDTLVVLWSVIPFATALALERFRLHRLAPVTWSAVVIGAVVFLSGLFHYDGAGTWFAMNASFWARLAFPLALFGVVWLSSSSPTQARIVVETIANATLAIAFTAECLRWADASAAVSWEMGVGIVSALWALQGAILIWLGLVQNLQPRRILGFALFGLAVGKTLIIDTRELDEVHRIVSYIVSGVLLLAAGFFYQRYSGRIMALAAGESNHEESRSDEGEQ